MNELDKVITVGYLNILEIRLILLIFLEQETTIGLCYTGS